MRGYFRRWRKRSRTLFWRISVAYLLLISATTVIFTLAFSASYRTYRDRVTQWTYWELAETLRGDFLPLLRQTTDSQFLRQRLFFYEQLNPNASVVIARKDGKVLLSTVMSHYVEQQIAVEPVAEFLAHRGQLQAPIYGWRLDEFGRVRTNVFSAAPMPFGADEAYLYVDLASERSSVLSGMAAQYAAIRGSIVGVLIAVALSSLLGLLVFYVITRRFYQMTEAIKSFQAGNLKTRVAVESNDEIGLYARAFNEMADTIQQTITALKHQDELRRSLITEISHDLRRPIAVSRTALELLMEKHRAIPAEERENYIARGLASLDGLTELMTDFFELSKLEAADYASNQTEFSLAEIIDGLLLEYTPLANSQDISFEVAAPDGPLICLGDAKLIQRTLSNLIENAIHYTPSGGSVTFRVAEADDKFELSVEDTGFGIAPEDLPRIFDRFYRTEQAQAYNKRGTGLGLSIAKKSIEAHGAELVVESTVGVGTRFSFRLRTVH